MSFLQKTLYISSIINQVIKIVNLHEYNMMYIFFFTNVSKLDNIYNRGLVVFKFIILIYVHKT